MSGRILPALCAFVLLALAVVAAAPAGELGDHGLAGRAPPPRLDSGSVRLTGATYGGSGCPMGRATVSLSEDKLALTVLYSAFVSSAGPGIDVLEARKACDLDIGLEFPPGFTFTVIKLDTRGFVSLDRSAQARLSTSMGFSDSPRRARSEARFRGPADRNYVQSRAFPAHERVASPCSPAGKDLLVTHEAEVTAPEGTQGLLSVDSSDLSVKQVFHLQWRRCE